MTRLATVLLIYLAGLASGLPAGVVAHEASAGAMSKTALNEGEKVSMANVAKADLKVCPPPNSISSVVGWGNGTDCTQMPQDTQKDIKISMQSPEANITHCYPPPYDACSETVDNITWNVCYVIITATGNCQPWWDHQN